MSEALRLADALDALLGYRGINKDVGDAAAELRRLHAENEALKTVMIAAAEEISANWDAHCDADGYGPANLMHRLERGIPSQYGYTAGDFDRFRALNAKLMTENEALKAINAELVEALRAASNYVDVLGGNSKVYRGLLAKAEAGK